MKRVLILGATSGIAEAFAHEVLKRFPQAKLCLVSRKLDKLQSIRDDLKVRFSSEISVVAADLNEFSAAPALLKQCALSFGDELGFDTVLIAHGFMEDEKLAQENFVKALPVLATNYISPVALCTYLIPYLGEGAALGVISSVAGDRGRPSNFVYGSAKAGLQAYLSGLRAKLFVKQIHVLDIRPGFVSTAMTAHLDRSGPLWATPEKVAADIANALVKRKDVLYTPWFWCAIMFIIRSIPIRIFKRLKL
ncbi:MAG: SDR family oxidoreductase [Bdellovibrionota bacterium]